MTECGDPQPSTCTHSWSQWGNWTGRSCFSHDHTLGWVHGVPTARPQPPSHQSREQTAAQTKGWVTDRAWAPTTATSSHSGQMYISRLWIADSTRLTPEKGTLQRWKPPMFWLSAWPLSHWRAELKSRQCSSPTEQRRQKSEPAPAAAAGKWGVPKVSGEGKENR